MDLLIFLYVPAITAAVSLIIPRKFKYFQETIAVIGSLIFLKFALATFTANDQFLTISWFQLSVIDFSLDFRLYHFSRFLLVFLGLFTLLTILYSAGYFRNKAVCHLYYPAILLALSGSAAIVLANNFFVLLIAWEVVTLLLFFLIAMNEGKPAAMAAGKAGLMIPEAAKEYCGPGLTEVCETIGIPPVLHMGACIDNSRILIAATAVVKDGGLGDDISDLPAAGAAPEWMSEKAIAIGQTAVVLQVMLNPELQHAHQRFGRIVIAFGVPVVVPWATTNHDD